MEGALPPAGLVFLRSVALDLNGFDPDDYPMHDFVFYYKLFLKGKIERFPDTLAFYRYSTDQTSNAVAQELIDKTYKYKISLSNTWIERYLSHKAIVSAHKLYQDVFNIDNLKLPFPYIKFRALKTQFIVYRWIRTKLMFVKNSFLKFN